MLKLYFRREHTLRRELEGFYGALRSGDSALDDQARRLQGALHGVEQLLRDEAVITRYLRAQPRRAVSVGWLLQSATGALQIAQEMGLLKHDERPNGTTELQ